MKTKVYDAHITVYPNYIEDTSYVSSTTHTGSWHACLEGEIEHETHPLSSGEGMVGISLDANGFTPQAALDALMLRIAEEDLTVTF